MKYPAARLQAAAHIAEIKKAIQMHRKAMTLNRGGPSEEDHELLRLLERELARWEGVLDELTASAMRVQAEILRDDSDKDREA